MRLEINFQDAVASLQEFLKENNHPTDVFWVFRDDLWRRSTTDVMLRYPSSANNLVLAQKVFSEGSKKGLVEIHAVAIAGNKVAATVWFPKLPNEQVQGWDRGMNLTLAQPMPRAKIVTPLRWWFFRFVPGFRQYQSVESTIGTKQWAAA